MRIGLFFIAALLVFPASVRAQDVTADPSFVVVEQQLEAVRKRDAATAFSLIAPSIQQNFADAKAYFRKVRFKERDLYSHISVKLLGSTRDVQSVIHRVELEDRTGDKSVVLFRVVADDQGLWRVKSAITLGRKDKAI